ncbi:MAG TPA: hypothetical protein VHB47_26085 [Thermoanaerobaculia bacterium]|nr:hypothetical protein [Thermoanaerobaculia bacterium]
MLEADPASGHDRKYLRELAEVVDFGGMTIVTKRPLPLGRLVRLRLYGPLAAVDRPSLRARALVRSRRAWFGQRHMALQFLDFEDLGSRSLASCLAAVLLAAMPLPGKRATPASVGRRWIAALLGGLGSAGVATEPPHRPASGRRAAANTPRRGARPDPAWPPPEGDVSFIA